MEFIRFTSSQRYGTRVPLRQLAFKVTVSRAFLIKDEAPEVLCEVTVPWNAKLPSPQERLSTYKQLEATLATAAPASVAVDGAAGQEGGNQIGAASAENDAALSVARLSGALPTVERIAAQLTDPTAQLFTRPPMEDFIDVAEEDFPVDPPMGPSLLAPIVLRQHRRDHQPNMNMYFMWAVGTLSGAPAPTSQPQQGELQQRGEAAEAAVADTPASAAGSGGGGGGGALCALEWNGEERVLFKITAERDENFFTAKPSLNTPHTILVDAVYIYSFTVQAVDVASLVKGSPRALAEASAAAAGEEEQGDTDNGAAQRSRRHRSRSAVRSAVSMEALAAATANNFLPAAAAATASTTLAAAEQVTESIRAVSIQAAEGLQALRISEEGSATAGVGGRGTASQAVAQRRLRDAVMSVPDNDREARTRGLADGLPSSSARAVAGSDGSGVAEGSRGDVDGLDATSRGRLGRGRRPSVAAMLRPPGEAEGCASIARCRYHVHGVVERCLGLPYDTLFLKCMLVQDTQPGAAEGTVRDVPAFFLEQEALANASAGFARGKPQPPSQHPQQTLFSTQLAYAGAVTVEDYVIEVDHVFNTPFEYTYVDDALPKAPLRLMVAALSEGFSGDGCQTPVGYCSVSLPVIVPGTHKVQCPMWAPHRTGKEFVKAAVAGGGPSLVDVRESGPALRNRTGISVKQGLLSDSAGLLCLTVNVMHQVGVV